MARYYTEMLHGKIQEVIGQDHSGIYSGSVRDGVVVISRVHRADRTVAKLPEWKDAHEIDTTEREFLDFVRRCERGPYTRTTPSEIKETPGTVEDVIRAVFVAAGAEVETVRLVPVP